MIGLVLQGRDGPSTLLQTWNLECDRYRHCVIAVDCFSKWVEIMPLWDKRSSTLADWLYREIIPRFGKPRWLRCNSGREFMGAFRALCEELGITFKICIKRFPRS